MRESIQDQPTILAQQWCEALNAALIDAEPGPMQALFVPDCHWRDVLALGWTIQTISGVGAVCDALVRYSRHQPARDFRLHPRRCQPRQVVRAGESVVEAIFQFNTRVGTCAAVVKLLPQAAGREPKAWALMTALEQIAGHPELADQPDRTEDAYARDFQGPNWLDRRQASAQYADRDPTALIVGGGHAGLTTAARLRQLGVDALIVDPMKRIGDNWRLRYHSLHLHNKTPVNHLPYMPFPATFPAYIPKDKLANWLEAYAEAMEVNFWTQTRFESAQYDGKTGCWQARCRLIDGSVREFNAKHIVMATSVSGTPKLPDIPTLDQFAGTCVHSSQYAHGDQWRDKSVMVLGTGTSAHDIAQDLHGHGAHVTMVQRSPTLVVNVDPSAQMYEEIFLGEGPPLEDRDLLSASMPLALIEKAHKAITRRVREIDKPLLDGLEKAGFRLEFGRDDTGWPLKFRERGGGYYFNIGCSELIIDGQIDLIQYLDIERFTQGGVRMKDGHTRAAQLVVLATGYLGQDHLIRRLFGERVSQRVGPVWGFDQNSQELRNMWMRTGQPGLWFTGGAFSQCRVYSKYLALQILADELGYFDRPASRTSSAPLPPSLGRV